MKKLLIAPTMLIAFIVFIGCDPGESENKKPIVSFVQPTSGTVSTDLGVVVEASDSDGSIANVELYLDGALVRVDSQSPYQWGTANNNNDPELMGLTPGVHSLHTVATDNEGAQSSATLSVTVGNTDGNQKPVVSFTQPDSSTVSSNIGVVVNASDPDGTIDNVKLFINNSLLHEEKQEPYEWGTANDNTDDPGLMGLAAGTYTLRAVATDNEGAKNSATISVTVEESQSEKTFICTKVKDNLDPDDFFHMETKLKAIGYTSVTMDKNVTTANLKKYFQQDIDLLYHTGHGNSGSIATSNGDFDTGDITTISAANTFIATCLTLKSKNWMNKFGPLTNTFAGYTKTTYGDGDIPAVNGYVANLKKGKGYAVAFYLGHADINLYQDRWCVYAKKGNQVVEYSARTNETPVIRNARQIDTTGKLFLADSFQIHRQAGLPYDEIVLGQIETRTRTHGNDLDLISKTGISKSDALEIAQYYLGELDEIEPDQVLDRIVPINYREGADGPDLPGGWQLTFVKQQKDGLTFRSNGLSLHSTLLITGDGEVVAFRKRWAKTKRTQYNAFNTGSLLSIADALSIAAPTISNNIKQDGKFILVDWVQVYGMDSRNPDKNLIRPAYGLIEKDGGIIVIDAENGKPL